jgi:hypothetical protein
MIAYASDQTITSDACAAIKTDTVATITTIICSVGSSLCLTAAVYDPDNSRHHQGVDHDVAETDGGTHKKLTKHRVASSHMCPNTSSVSIVQQRSPSAGLRALARMAR